MLRQYNIQCSIKPNSHITPDIQIYFICIQDVMGIIIIKKCGIQYKGYIYIIRMRNYFKEKINYNL